MKNILILNILINNHPISLINNTVQNVANSKAKGVKFSEIIHSVSYFAGYMEV